LFKFALSPKHKSTEIKEERTSTWLLWHKRNGVLLVVLVVAMAMAMAIK
jgi:hypothetical protein